jgi:hypothetical protein
MAAIAVDMEWYATVAPEPVPGGYRQAGEAHTVVELAGGPLELVGPAARTHVWGGVAVPEEDGDGVHGPAAYLRTDHGVVERTLAADGWRTVSRSRPRPGPRASPPGGA